MSDYYDLDGNPIDMDEWGRLMQEKHTARRGGNDGWTTPAQDPTRIGYDEIGDIHVSTVWLGLNHNFGDGPPLIFETMVFGGDDEWDQWQDRYSTKEAAAVGHRVVCAAIRAGMKP